METVPNVVLNVRGYLHGLSWHIRFIPVCQNMCINTAIS